MSTTRPTAKSGWSSTAVSYCYNDWNTEPAHDYCRPSSSGTVYTGFRCEPGFAACSPTVSVNVQVHGYVVLKSVSATEIDVCVWSEFDELLGCKSFNPSADGT